MERRTHVTKMLLSIEHLTKRFGGVTAVDDVSFSVLNGEIVGLIGPNGSGKTTLFNCITGFLVPEPPSRVELLGTAITGYSPDQVSRRGMVRTFQEVRIFKQMSVMENLLMSVQQHQEDRVWARFVNTPQLQAFEAKGKARAMELLQLVGLTDYIGEPAASLSYGQRKLLTFVSALMPDPPLVLLDEPAAAINPVLIDKIKEHIVSLNRSGKTFLLIEHNMDVVMDICHRIVVLDHGKKIAEGAPEVIQNDERVIDAYFGT
jgi:ABC-type branched-subunit amino acid transport system ATPase component